MVNITAFNNENNYGDQRHIFVQLTLNKRRHRRHGKTETPYTLPILERVYYVFNNGKIIDYIHPREIDPYWGILYRQFEYLTYCETIYRYKIENNYNDIPKVELNLLFETLFKMEKYKKDLVQYMLQFMQLLYGSVMKNRFWGFSKKHGEEFISMFKYLVLKNIKELKFDVSKTRCSVYYYQLLWLSGIGLTKEIREKYKREKLKNDENNRGTTLYSKTNKYNNGYNEVEVKLDAYNVKTDEDVDLCDKLSSLKQNISNEYNNIYNEYYNSDDYAANDENIFGDITLNDFTIESKHNAIDSDIHTTQHANTLFIINEIKVPLDETDIIADGEPDEETQRLNVVNKLLIKLDISPDLIYKITDKEIIKIGKHLRKTIKKGKIKFTDTEIKLLQKYFKNDKR